MGSPYFTMEENMKQIKVDTGLVTYRLNDAVEVSFNPTDMEFGNRVYAIAETLDKKQDEYQKAITDNKNNAELFEVCRAIDKEMRDMINGLFDKDICTPLIGNINIYAYADGAPIWANILTAFVDEMDAGVTEAQKASQKKISKYTKKYHK